MAETLRVGIICYPTMGGSGAVAVDLAAALANRGHEIHVISYATPFRTESSGRLMFHEVDVPSYPLFKYPPYAMALASKLAEVAAQHRLQILHAHYAIPHSMAAFLAREMLEDESVKVITTLHGTDITLVGTDPSYRTSTRFGLRKSDGISAVSKFLARETAQLIGDCAHIEVIHNFVDTMRYRPAEEKKLREFYAKPQEPLMMHLSNFRPVKRVLDVVRIFEVVNGRRPSRLVMAGDGPDRPAAERLVRELELHNRVTFTGAVPNAAQLLAQADAFILPSDGESFGLAALEALSTGVPVVGALAGGLPEVVENGRSGILEQVGDTDAMGRRLADLLTDPEASGQASAEARRRVESMFRTDLLVPKYEDLYRRCLD